MLERGPYLRVDRSRRFRIVQPILRLTLELRLLQEDAEDPDEAFADVLGGERHALRREIVRVDEIADGLAQTGTEPVLVGPSRSGRNAVDIAAEVLVG